MYQRYRIFLFPRKRLGGTHSLDLGNFCFFLFPDFGKKKTSCFFFPRKRLQAFRCYFFFPKKIPKLCFFSFPRKRLHVTHSLEFQGRKKKTAPEKKKNSIFTHSLDFPQKSANFNLFRGNKKIRYLCPHHPILNFLDVNHQNYFRTKE